MTTNMTGIVRARSGNIKLQKLYTKILKLVEKFPKEASYRKNVEAIICERLSIVNEAGSDRYCIENNICSGSLEMLLLQAENEYKLVQKMIFWKPWEPLMEHPPREQWTWPPPNQHLFK